MKISLNWIKQYIELSLEPEAVSHLLTDIGLEVEGMEITENIRGGLKGLVVGEVLECEKHPNADRLSLTRVDIGQGEPLHIVCGAPNVAKGQKVIVAPDGTTVHPTEGEPFLIKSGKIRGELSQGMICSEDEVGLGASHDGILVLPPDTRVGIPVASLYHIEQDVVYEIGLTPNRSDATCHLGVARDLWAALQVRKGFSTPLNIPRAPRAEITAGSHPVQVIVENPEACPRYAGITLSGVKVGESPEWLKNRLLSIGLRPINNVVDITNFVLHEWGQPLHAFDLAAIQDRTIRVKTLPGDTLFTTLDGKERRLFAEDLMICDERSTGMCIAGVFGGATSGVTETTTDIFLESAHFNPKYVRRTSMRHDLRTDAARVFEKGSDPTAVIPALERAAALICELAGGQIASQVVDVYPNPIAPARIDLELAFVNRLIGLNLEAADVRTILQALDMTIVRETEAGFTVEVPQNKVDVTRPVDLVEEILRIYGVNEVPIPEKLQSALSYNPFPDPGKVYHTVADYLAANGFQEMMSLSLSESRYYRDMLPRDPETLVFINNTSSAQLDIMRPSMLFSGLEAVVHNQNRQQSDLRLFEFGKTYHKGAEGFVENRHISLFWTGRRWPENWLYPGGESVGPYALKAIVENILRRLGISGYQETGFQDDVFQFGMRFSRGPVVLAEFGQVQAQIQKKMDIRQPVLAADLYWDELLAASSKQKISFRELNRFPSTRRDLSMVVENSVKFADIVAIARKAGKSWLKETNLFDVYTHDEQVGKGKKSYAVSYVFADPEKTLQDKEVDQIMDDLIRAYETELGAHIRR